MQCRLSGCVSGVNGNVPFLVPRHPRRVGAASSLGSVAGRWLVSRVEASHMTNPQTPAFAVLIGR